MNPADIHTCTPPAQPATEDSSAVQPAAQLAPVQEPVALHAMAKRRIFDAIRSAYDLGYNDARNARTTPGDSAPGYKGRDVEADHGGALICALERYTTPPAQEFICSTGLCHYKAAPVQEPVGRTDQQIVDQTEELAVWLLSWCFNYQPETDTPMRRSTHPFAERCWAAACHIQEMLTATDPENAVAELDVAPEKGGAA